MAATRSDISGWFDRGVAEGYKIMIVWCDTFDYEDYPVYYESRETAISAKKTPDSMQRLMESYDLTADKETQLNATRTHCI